MFDSWQSPPSVWLRLLLWVLSPYCNLRGEILEIIPLPLRSPCNQHLFGCRDSTLLTSLGAKGRCARVVDSPPDFP